MTGDAELAPMIRGGGQERGRRAGTENLPGIAGFAAAAEAAAAGDRRLRPGARDCATRLEAAASPRGPDAVVIGAGVPRLPNTSALAHARASPAETQVIALDLDGVMVSAGAACSSGKVGPSHVLAAMGVAPEIAGSHDPRQPRLDARPRPTSPISSRPGPRSPGGCGRTDRRGRHERTAAVRASTERANALPIYLDNQASTPLDPRVLEAMLPYFTEHFGNPHSESHVYGSNAAGGDRGGARRGRALIDADPREIVFTSGATEANNLAIKGAAHFARAHPPAEGPPRDHIVTLHDRAQMRARKLPRRWSARAFAVTYLPVEPNGLVSLDRLAAALDRAHLAGLGHGGAQRDRRDPAARRDRRAVPRRSGVLFHTDAAQAVGKIPLDVEAMKIDLMSISGHKIYGPKGVGALYVRRRPRVRLLPLIDGGGQERGLRSGTLPTPLCVGLGRAAAIAARRDGGRERSGCAACATGCGTI